MTCPFQCFLVGGPWISCNPDCPEHGPDRPPTERAVDLEHGDECRSVWADDRICDCGAETIRDLRAEVERLKASIYAERKEREVWAARARDYCKSWDDSRAAAERLQTVAFQAQNAAIDLAQQVATLTAERDAARRQLEDLAYSHSLCGDLRDECINAETEACAKVLDKLAAEFRAKTGPHHDVDTGDGLAAEIDRAIRARGAK